VLKPRRPPGERLDALRRWPEDGMRPQRCQRRPPFRCAGVNVAWRVEVHSPALRWGATPTTGGPCPTSAAASWTAAAVAAGTLAGRKTGRQVDGACSPPQIRHASAGAHDCFGAHNHVLRCGADTTTCGPSITSVPTADRPLRDLPHCVRLAAEPSVGRMGRGRLREVIPGAGAQVSGWRWWGCVSNCG
jgi:hypothetical protein